MDSSQRFRFAVVGLGGYAGNTCDLLMAQSADPAAGVAFVGACDPNPAAHGDRAGRLRDAGVPVFERFDDLLAVPADAVWLPLPIQLHRPFTERVLAAGRAVLVEKPAAGSVQDVDAMIAARDAARLPVAVGFQDVYDPAVARLKRRLVGGAIGRVTGATLVACWPRDVAYYGRSAWAGRLGVDGARVLDSPANNALAHFIHLVLYLLGDAEHAWAQPAAVEAELYRANAIENYDTCGLRVTTAAGATALVLLTHACRESVNPLIELTGTAGRAMVRASDAADVVTPAGTETIPFSRSSRADVVRNFSRWARGLPTDAAVGTLEGARTHAVVVNGASQATPVRDVPAAHVAREAWPTGNPGRSIPGIEAAFRACAASGRMPHESGLLPWTAPAGRASLDGYRTFDGPAKE